jgi:hypothetical protein
MTETLRDSHGVKIGTLEDNGNQIVARDAHGVKVGTYEKSSNVTRDAHGVKVGSGNLLAMLLNK